MTHGFNELIPTISLADLICIVWFVVRLILVVLYFVIFWNFLEMYSIYFYIIWSRNGSFNALRLDCIIYTIQYFHKNECISDRAMPPFEITTSYTSRCSLNTCKSQTDIISLCSAIFPWKFADCNLWYNISPNILNLSDTTDYFNREPIIIKQELN